MRLLPPFLAVLAAPALAHGPGAVIAAPSPDVRAPFDILAAHVERDGRTLVFRMTAAGAAGSETPPPTGALGGAPVFAYVWPTSLDPATVGFEGGGGLLAFVATSHPDFDDTPLFDEDANGDPSDDGARWHSHWVVLAPTEACGAGALAVRDIPEGATPAMPGTWPGLPLYLDSPGWTPLFAGPEVTARVPFDDPSVLDGMAFDGVTAALRVDANLHAPLLCVTDVFDVASGNLDLPGRVD
jgi:hypothetical protein